MSKQAIRADLQSARRHLGVALDRRDATQTIFVGQALLDIIRAVEQLVDDVDTEY